MAGPLLANRCKETTATTGTGDLTLLGAAPGRPRSRAFAAGIAVGDSCYYSVEHQSADEWEDGVGTLTAANTLRRDAVETSSNGNALVDFSAGTKDVYITATKAFLQPMTAAGDVVYQAADGKPTRLPAGTAGFVLTVGVDGLPAWAAAAGGVTDHGGLTGLADDDHAQYALLAGRAGGQTLVGGLAAGESLTLQSTADATKGKVFIGGGGAVFGVDEASGNMALGIAVSPTQIARAYIRKDLTFENLSKNGLLCYLAVQGNVAGNSQCSGTSSFVHMDPLGGTLGTAGTSSQFQAFFGQVRVGSGVAGESGTCPGLMVSYHSQFLAQSNSIALTKGYAAYYDRGVVSLFGYTGTINEYWAALFAAVAPGGGLTTAHGIHQLGTQQDNLFAGPTAFTGTLTFTGDALSSLAEVVDDRVAALLVAGANVTLTYDDVANTLTVTAAGGVTDHAALDNLAYAASGHTGFAGTAVANTFTQTQTFRPANADVKARWDREDGVLRTHIDADGMLHIQAHAGGLFGIRIKNSAGTTNFSVTTDTGQISTNAEIQSAVAFRVTAFGAYVGVQGNSRLEFYNGHISVASGVLEFPVIASGGTPSTNSARIYAKDVAGTAQMFVKSEDGTETQISPHAQDAPASLYDAPAAGSPLPATIPHANPYVGSLEYLALSRTCRVVESLLKAIYNGRSLAEIRTALQQRPLAAYDLWRVETFAEHNVRLGLTGAAALAVRSWSTDQEAHQAAYDAARADELARRDAWDAERTAELDAAALWDATPPEERQGPRPEVRPLEQRPEVREVRDIRKPVPPWLAARGVT